MSRSSISRQKTIGRWLPADALWNYLDVPHLNYVHTAVSGEEFYSSDAASVSVFEQRVFGLRVQAVTAIVRRSDELVEYVTSLPFVRIAVATKIAGANGQCQVETVYTVTSSFLLRPLHGLVHWALARNYRLLMSEDLPMREQRERLRARGVRFARDVEGYGFEASKRVRENNVIPAHGDPETISLSSLGLEQGEWSRFVLSNGLEILVSMSDDDEMLVLPGVCPHEGAALGSATECSDSENCQIRCPWHGRVFRPLTLSPNSSVLLGRLTISRRDDSIVVVAEPAA